MTGWPQERYATASELTVTPTQVSPCHARSKRNASPPRHLLVFLHGRESLHDDVSDPLGKTFVTFQILNIVSR